jgi:Kef-type K+ transport system membrane component KefB
MSALALAIVQICVILAATRLLALVFRIFRQPAVVGELIAGIMLGPSLLGLVAPSVSAALFPAQSLGFLSTLSQLGLLLFMFLVGLELDPREFNREPLRKIAVITSHVSIAVPFVLGAALALPLFADLAGPQATPLTFALFMGTAMSITAFPVLARILRERGMQGSQLGALATACAAIDDVTAWCMLAAVVVIVQTSQAGASLGVTVGGTLAFAAFMLFVGRRWLIGLETAHARAGRLTNELLTVTLLVMLVSAVITELLGIHALFGAFLAGAVMPKDKAFMRALSDKLEDVTVVLLVPLYFAFTGLRTSVGLFGSDPKLWAVCGLIILVASLGKFGGATFASYRTGLPLRAAGALGVLMNTRGLVELVVLNVGLDIGVLSPQLFAMMVLMALATTLMTSPLLQWIYPVDSDLPAGIFMPAPALDSAP